MSAISRNLLPADGSVYTIFLLADFLRCLVRSPLPRPRLSFTPEMQSGDICCASRHFAAASLSSLRNMKSACLLLVLSLLTADPTDCQQSRNWGSQTRPASDCLPLNEGVVFLCSANQTRIGKISDGVECETTCDTAKFKFTCSDGEWIYSHPDLHDYPPCLFAFRCKHLRDTTNKAKLTIIREARVGDWPVPFFGTEVQIDCRRDGSQVRKVCRANGTWSGPKPDCIEEVSFDHSGLNSNHGSKQKVLVWCLVATCCIFLLVTIGLAINTRRRRLDHDRELTRSQGIRTYVRRKRFKKHSILLFANPTYGHLMAPEPPL